MSPVCLWCVVSCQCSVGVCSCALRLLHRAVDVTINRLREQLKSLEDELDVRVEERVRARVVELAADHEEQERGLQSAREEMQQRMAHGESKFATMRQGWDSGIDNHCIHLYCTL